MGGRNILSVMAETASLAPKTAASPASGATPECGNVPQPLEVVNDPRSIRSNESSDTSWRPSGPEPSREGRYKVTATLVSFAAAGRGKSAKVGTTHD